MRPMGTKRILTPPVKPAFEIEKLRQNAQTVLAAPASRGSGGSGGPTFEALLKEAQSYYTPETVAYTPLSEETLKELLSGSLRPAYDEAIEARRERTRAYNAALDADAWARGMGQSTYVTDAKRRNYGDEGRDLSALEASYSAVLADKLLDALQKQAETQISVEKFNAEQINEARARAYNAATALYRASQSGGTGSGSGGRQTVSAALNAPTDPIHETLRQNLTSAPVYDTIETPSGETIERVLSRMSGSEREKLYEGRTKTAQKMLAEIYKSLGKTGAQSMMKKYPSVK